MCTRYVERAAISLAQCTPDGLVCKSTDESTRFREPGGHHGERPDAKQQGKEEAEAGQEQEKTRRCPVDVHAKPVQCRHKLVRQEEQAVRELSRDISNTGPSTAASSGRDRQQARLALRNLKRRARSSPCPCWRLLRSFVIVFDHWLHWVIFLSGKTRRPRAFV